MIPVFFDYLKRKDELKYETQLLSLKAKYAEQETNNKISIIQAESIATEGKSLRDHDSSLMSESAFITDLRASVRPVVTYFFFALFIFMKLVTIMSFIKYNVQTDMLGNALAWAEIMPLIWDQDTSSIFGAIVGFWFGSRQIEKARGV